MPSMTFMVGAPWALGTTGRLRERAAGRRPRSLYLRSAQHRDPARSERRSMRTSTRFSTLAPGRLAPLEELTRTATARVKREWTPDERQRYFHEPPAR